MHFSEASASPSTVSSCQAEYLAYDFVRLLYPPPVIHKVEKQLSSMASKIGRIVRASRASRTLAPDGDAKFIGAETF